MLILYLLLENYFIHTVDLCFYYFPCLIFDSKKANFFTISEYPLVNLAIFHEDALSIVFIISKVSHI